MTKPHPSLPTNRGFMMQLHAEVQPEQEHWKGRIEYLISGQTGHFHSAEGLLAFLRRILGAQQLAEARKQ